MSATVCIVEDDPIMGQSLKDRFELEGIDCVWKQSLTTAKEALLLTPFTVVICDMRLPDGTGASLFEELLEQTGNLPVFIFVTGYGDLDQAVHLLKLGAADYITKPFDMSELLAKLLSLCPELDSKTHVQNELSDLGVSTVAKQLQNTLLQLSNYDVPVLITGESGVGKEHAAWFLHKHSECKGEFLAVNCAAISETMLEAELFGHVAGAFTDAKAARKGLFEQADNGTLFLDEVGEMSLNMQGKLLRVLQDLRVRRVGGNQSILVNTRLIFATNCNLQQMIQQKQFREDLYYRINTINVHIPPLRERIDDIWWFANLFLKQNKIDSKRLLISCKNHLESQEWKGNNRELKGVIQRACILTQGDTIGINDLIEKNNVSVELQAPELKPYLKQCEQAFIEQTLKKNDNRIGITADELGISRKNLWERLNKDK